MVRISEIAFWCVATLAVVDAFTTQLSSRISDGIKPHMSIAHMSSSSHDETVGVAAAEMDDDVELDDAALDALMKQKTAMLCSERNLPLAKVKNARDLGSVRNSPIKPGKIFRMGRLGDATPEDQKILFDQIGLKTLVDLRSPTELKDDASLSSKVFENFTDMVWIENRRAKDGCLKEIKAGESPIAKRNRFGRSGKDSSSSAGIDPEDEMCEYDCNDPGSLPAPTMLEKTAGRKERHFVSLMNEFKYVRGTVSRIRKRDVARSMLKAPGALVSKRVWESLKRPFIEEINDGGLIMLNDLLLRFGAPGIKYVLELCADENRHPVAFYCTAGKDRTGAITAIILSLLGGDMDDIVEDYGLSANVYAEMNDHKAMVGALSQRSLDPKTFLGAPPQVMRDTLLSIEENYGSVEAYCDWIGFGPELREKLRKNLKKTE
jgi:protein tyrosine/serine phosphatase